MANETLGLKNVNFMSKSIFDSLEETNPDEIYAVESDDVKLIEAYNGDSSWYRLYSDGFIIQGGYTTTASAGMSITLPHTMKDGNYSCVATVMRTVNEHSVAISGRTATSFSFTIRGTNGASNQGSIIAWQLEGYVE